ncbi:MAG: serine/threonine-protein kinase [Gemmatimonadota bacterium]
MIEARDRGAVDVAPPRIGRPLADAGPTGGSFTLEQRDLLWRRCRLVFALGLAVSLVLSAATLFFGHIAPPIADRFATLKAGLDQGYAVLFAVALGAIHIGEPGVGRLQGTAFAVIGLNIVLALVTGALARPDASGAFGLPLLLFVPAAFIPWRTAYQTGLAVVALVGGIVAGLTSYVLVPEVSGFWAAAPAGAFRDHLVLAATGTAVLGATSVVVTGTLYRLRRTAHRAKRLGNYLIHRELGRGGMGRVYVAEHALMCRPSAVKVLQPAPGENGSALARFEREVRLSSSLSHPNTITIFDFGRAEDDTFYYAMEYLEGMDLQVLVERFGPLPAPRVVYILLQVTGSLAEAHGRDIVHRDLKPANIFLTTRGGLYDFVKVLDFGLAKEVRSQGASDLTRDGAIFGTPRYIAPETVYGTAVADARSDIYNVGGVAYWMLAGRPPFAAESPIELMIDHVKTVPPRPSEVSELEVPSDLDRIVMRCLEKNPDDRYQTVKELAADLRAVPLDEPWDGERAEEWWALHLASDPFVEGCFCPPIEETAER